MTASEILPPEILNLDGDLERQPANAVYPELVIEGQPTEKTLAIYGKADEGFSAGLWSSTKGKWAVPGCPFSEYCHLRKGKVILTSDSGVAKEYVAGDIFLIPFGFKGTWETVEDCEKYFVCNWGS